MTGKDGQVKLAGTAITGDLTNWDHHYIGNLVESKPAGNNWVKREPIHKDWEATIDVNLPNTAYTSRGALLNTALALTLYVQASDVTPFFAATGYVADILSHSPSDDTVTTRLQIKGDGTAPTTA